MNPASTGKSKKTASGRLADINRAITTSLNFDKVLDLIVENATQLVGARVCVLLLVDKMGMLRIQAARGLDPEISKDFVAQMDEDAVKVLHDVLAVRPEEVLVSVPVIAKHAVNGFLAIVRDHPLDAEEEWQLSALADQAEIALQNARLYEMELAEANRERDETLEALRESNQKIKTILESITDLFYELDREWRFVEVNKRVEELFGKSRDELIGQVIWDTYPDAPSSLLYPNFLKAIETMTPCHFELQSKIVLGAWFEVHAYPAATGLTVYLRDITERVRSEEEIRFRARLLNTVEQGVIATNLEGTVIYWNAFAEQLYGWPAVEALGANIFDLTVADASKELGEQIFSQMTVGASWSGEFLVRRRDGSVFPVQVTDSPIFNDKNELIGVVGVSSDITQRKLAEEERAKLLDAEREARAEAEKANHLKDEFLATLSHELRNPLNVVIGYADILLRSGETHKHEFVLQAAKTIRRNAMAQSRLVSDLLDLSRLQMGKLSLNLQPLSFSTIICDAIDTVRDAAAEKDISLELDTNSEAFIVEGDPVRLAQIAWNLLNNAVKFTPAQGRINVSLTRAGGEAYLAVKDTGQGITPEFVPHVFEIFRQADASSSRRHEGMGIGLALVKQLAELHDGRVSAESPGSGQGATFSVWIPLSPEETSTSLSEAPVNAGTLKAKSILVVDDSRETADMLTTLLTTEGAQVSSARSGEDALRLVRENTFDLVISDISMPEMDGYQLLEKIRALSCAKDLPALALTGYGRTTDIERAEAAGFVRHLTKPLDIGRLLEVVRELTEKGRI
jgi:two-component system CheB/CheR fusion protein